MSTTRSLISHLNRHTVPTKQCYRCHRDIGQEWRTKTPDGRYICQPCLHTLKELADPKKLGLFADDSLLVSVKTGN
jgi:hypothetical protein